MLKLEEIKLSLACQSAIENDGLLIFIKENMSFAAILMSMHRSLFYRLRRCLWPVFALVFTYSLPAHARWESVGLYSIGMFYIDTASLVREGDFRKLNSSLDYREAQNSTDGRKFLSTRSQLHIDCKQELVRTLHLTIFAGPMLSGEVIESGGILKEWQLIPTETAMHQIWYRVC